MSIGLSLHDTLRSGPASPAVADVVEGLARAAVTTAEAVAAIALPHADPASRSRNATGDRQHALDLEAHRLFRSALLDTAVAAFVSEEADAVEILNPNGGLSVAVDPLDGSGNFDLNAPVGSIFSVMPNRRPVTDLAPPFDWPAGGDQLAAGFFVYGVQTTLVLTTGEQVDLFVYDRARDAFLLARAGLQMPPVAPDEYAINTSNYRHWEEPVRAFVDECVAGAAGPYGRDFNMRWHGALIAEAYRILQRGGIYLYPQDRRESYREGRLRLIYEAFPLALLIERAGGAASNGRRRILDISATSPHQRVPLVFGSRPLVEHLEALHHRPGLWPPAAAPLFASRGLFRS